MAVMVLNYADVIDIPRKNLFSNFFSDSDSWDFSDGGGGGDSDGVGYLILFFIIFVIALVMLIPLIYPELIFILFYAGYIFVSFYYSSKSGIGQGTNYCIFTWLTFSWFYQIFYLFYNCGFSKSRYLEYED